MEKMTFPLKLKQDLYIKGEKNRNYTFWNRRCEWWLIPFLTVENSAT